MEICCSSMVVNAIRQAGAGRINIEERWEDGLPKGFVLRVSPSTLLRPHRLYGIIKTADTHGFDLRSYDRRLNIVFQQRLP